MGYNWIIQSCLDLNQNVNYYDEFSGWQYYDPSGTAHPFNSLVVSDISTMTDCNPSAGPPSSASATTWDDSGYELAATANPGATVYSRSGTVINAPWGVPGGSGSVVDSNGNQLTMTAGTSTTFTDTLGTTALTISGSGTPTSPMTYVYINPSPPGGSSQVTVNYSAYTVQTNFGCSGISEFGPTAENLVSSITLPDGTSYSFNYEPTPGVSGAFTGRIASVTLPTGGTTTYSYSGANNGITCADGSTATLARATPDGTWNYAHSESGSAWTDTVTDPNGNQTWIYSQGIYETERDIYQGASPGGTILAMIFTCYNGDANLRCNSDTFGLPITERKMVTIRDDSLESEVNAN